MGLGSYIHGYTTQSSNEKSSGGEEEAFMSVRIEDFLAVVVRVWELRSLRPPWPPWQHMRAALRETPYHALRLHQRLFFEIIRDHSRRERNQMFCEVE